MAKYAKIHWAHFLLAVLGPVLLLWLRLGIAGWAPIDYSPFLTYWVVIIICSWLGGLGPGLAATVCSSILISYFQLHPFSGVGIARPYEAVSLIAFTIMGAVTSVLGQLRFHAFNMVKQSEERFHMVMEATREGIWDWNLQTGAVYYSPAYFTMLGYEPKEASPDIQDWIGLLHPEDKEQALKANQKCIDGQVDSFEVEFRMKARSGAWRWIRGRGKVVGRDVHGRALRLVGTHLDVTERKQYEEALRQSEVKYRQVSEALPLALWTAKPDGIINFYNQFWLNYTGRTMEECLGGDWTDNLHPEDRERARVARAEGYRTSRPFTMEYRVRRAADGQYRWFYVQLTPVFDEFGTLANWVGTATDVHDRKLAENTAHQERDFTAAVLDTAGSLIIVLDSEARLIRFNRACEALTGYSADEVLGKLFFFFIFPDEDAQVRGKFEEVKNGCFRGTIENHWRTRGGERRLISWSNTLLLNSEGKTEYVIASGTDITDQRKADIELRQSEERIRLAAEVTGFGIYDMDLITGKRYWSTELKAILGLAPDATPPAEEQNFQNIFHPEDRDRVMRELIAAQDPQGSGSYEGTHRLLRVDGEVRWVMVRGRTLFAGEGPERRPVRRTGIVFDITERLRAEAELRQSEERMRLAAEVTGFGIYDMDLITGKRYWSPELNAIMGRPPEAPPQLDEQGLPTFIFPEDREAVLREMCAAMDPRSSGIYKGIHRILRGDGSVRWMMVRGRTFFAGEGESRRPVRATGAVIDITERKEIENALRAAKERLEDADRRKDEFLAMLAHELRNPLAPIRNAIQVMRLAGKNEAIRERQQQTIDRQVGHMARLLDDLLDISRITRGKIQLRKRPVQLDEVMTQAVETAAPLMEARNQRLAFQTPPGDLCVDADWDRMVQIMGNLLTNAAKYTDEGGQIWLEVSREGFDAVIRVRDSGIGISPDLLPHVFELFIQADQSLDRSRGGLGIGLTMVQQLVRMHGGSVEARSGGPGQGSEFIVRLPALDASPHEASAPIELSDGNLKDVCCRVLVVDDVIDSARSLAELLELWNQTVRVAHDGPGALEVAREFQPDVVLLDIGLPGMDGYEVARRLRVETRERKMLLIAMTGYGQDEDRQSAIEAGFDRHMVKPIDLNALRDLLMRSMA